MIKTSFNPFGNFKPPTNGNSKSTSQEKEGTSKPSANGNSKPTSQEREGNFKPPVNSKLTSSAIGDFKPPTNTKLTPTTQERVSNFNPSTMSPREDLKLTLEDKADLKTLQGGFSKISNVKDSDGITRISQRELSTYLLNTEPSSDPQLISAAQRLANQNILDRYSLTKDGRISQGDIQTILDLYG